MTLVLLNMGSPSKAFGPRSARGLTAQGNDDRGLTFIEDFVEAAEFELAGADSQNLIVDGAPRVFVVPEGESEAVEVSRNPNESDADYYQRIDRHINQMNGSDRWEIPVPATYVIDRDGTIQFDFVDLNHRVRAEPADVIAIAAGL